jgi:hypothetical protein
MKDRKRIPYKVKAVLQKEINSECPFCSNQEVECFEAHHIDEDPSNNDIQNLILLCAVCHSKIEKNIITQEEVVARKNELKLRSWKIEFASATIDSSCGWVVSEANEYAFFCNEREPNNPVLNFTFINHLSRTVVLRTIVARYEALFSGISGPPPEAKVLSPLYRYHIPLNYRNNTLHLENPIAVPVSEAFQFQVELSQGAGYNLSRPFNRRKALYFTFHFSSAVTVNVPTIFFNCNSENEGITLVLQS